MDYEIKGKINSQLAKIANENKLTIFTGHKKSLDNIAKEYDGLNVFITDGSPSHEKILLSSGESISYEATQIVKLSKKEIYDEPVPGEEESLHYIIGLAIKHFPHLRYHQILHNLNVIVPADLNDENQKYTVDEFGINDDYVIKRVKSSNLYKTIISLEKDE